MCDKSPQSCKKLNVKKDTDLQKKYLLIKNESCTQKNVFTKITGIGSKFHVQYYKQFNLYWVV